jgi:hypothetical protein
VRLPTTLRPLRGQHRTFLLWAVLVLFATSVALGVVGVATDGWTAGTWVRLVFILGMAVFWVITIRAGTTVDAAGLTVRRGLGTRRVLWSRVDRLGTDQPGPTARRVTALVDGSPVLLPGVLVAELGPLEQVWRDALTR